MSTTSRAVTVAEWVCATCRASAARNRVQMRAKSAIRRQISPHESRQAYSLGGNTGSQQRSFASCARRQKWAKDVTPRREKLPEYPARTRFAPSPTGFMHIGGLRTALFSYLLAARTGGQFILRIEDTDQKRWVEGAEQRILDDLRWAGLQWDEGPKVGGPHGPYKQSQRNDIYQEHARQLLDSGAAYRCFCTPQTAGQGSAAFVTSGCYQNCSSLSQIESLEKAEQRKQPFTVRLVVPPHAYKRVYPDLIYGNIKRLKRSPSASPVSAGSAEDGSEGGADATDTILVKTDGTPTYHFANVVDDHLMKITHVIRGTEWMASTPLHYDLYHAFGWNPPDFAHVGLLLDYKKAKLSKRSGTIASDVAGLRDQMGILPEALVNFLVLLGWSNPRKDDVMSMQDMIRTFDLKFTTGNTICDTKKLMFLQKRHVQHSCLEARQKGTFQPITRVVDCIRDAVVAQYEHCLTGRALDTNNAGKLWDFCASVLLADDKSFESAGQFVERNNYLFTYDVNRMPLQEAQLDVPLDEDGRQLSDELLRFLRHKVEVPAQISSDALTASSRSASTELIKDSAKMKHLASASEGIHQSLVRLIWQVVAYQDLQPTITESGEPSTKRTRAETDKLIRSAVDLSHEYGDSIATVAVRLARLDLRDGEIEGLEDKYKLLNKQAMKLLRQNLCYGKPGPSMGSVIALLGFKECAARMEAVREKGGQSTVHKAVASDGVRESAV